MIPTTSEPGTTREAAAPVDELPLRAEHLDQLERELTNEPDETLSRIRRSWDASVTEEQVWALIDRARATLAEPRAALAASEAARCIDPAVNVPLPDSFDFPGRTPEIPIDPTDCRFETERDALGWILHAGPLWLKYRYHPEKADFRWADDAPSRFIYEMPTLTRPIEIALFSDFGTGLYHSRYIARQLAGRRPDYAIHLGDVYYAGKASEFGAYFTPVLEPLLATTRVFALNSNHEMLSGGQFYFEYLDQKHRSAPPPAQEQEGSYFCLRSSRFQFVAVDTDYHHDGGYAARLREPRLRAWLRQRLDEGRAAGLVNVLLTANEPYEVGKPALTPLFATDLADVLADGLVDLWFWGNTHYCALFERSPRTPFVGCCIGHGGYPYTRKRDADCAGTPTGVRFLETSARFPKWTGVRQDRGNNGYLALSLRPDGSVALELIDWMGTSRHRDLLVRASVGPHLDFAAAAAPTRR